MARKKKNQEEQLMLDGVTAPQVFACEQIETETEPQADENQITFFDMNESILEEKIVADLLKQAKRQKKNQEKRKQP